MLRTADCFKNLFQYKSVCPELQTSYLLDDNLDKNQLSIEELQELYSKYKQKFVALTNCEQKRSYVYNNCYGDEDEGHRKAIERVRNQKEECLHTLTLLATELQNYINKRFDKNEEEVSLQPELIIAGKNAKKNAKKRRQKATQRVLKKIEDDEEYKKLWNDLQQRMDKNEAMQANVHFRILTITERLHDYYPNDPRIASLLEVIKRRTDGGLVIYALAFTHPNELPPQTSGFMNLERINNIDVSVLTDTDLKQWINYTIHRLIPFSENFKVIDGHQERLRKQGWSLHVRLKVMLGWWLYAIACFDVNLYLMPSESELLSIITVTLLGPIITSVVLPEIGDQINANARSRYLENFKVQDRYDVEKRIEDLYRVLDDKLQFKGKTQVRYALLERGLTAIPGEKPTEAIREFLYRSASIDVSIVDMKFIEHTANQYASSGTLEGIYMAVPERRNITIPMKTTFLSDDHRFSNHC